MKPIATLILVLAALAGLFAAPAETAPSHASLGVRGRILAFDATRSAFIMYNHRAGRIAVYVDSDSTSVAINQQPARLSDLRVGMYAMVSGPIAPVTRRMRAQTIRIRQ
jgi:hypothetical protein